VPKLSAIHDLRFLATQNPRRVAQLSPSVGEAWGIKARGQEQF
jgi:hypothetical protein